MIQRIRAMPRWAHVVYVSAVVVAALSIRLYWLESTYVLEASMEPTIHEGERLLVYKQAYHDRAPQRGDIVVVQMPGSRDIYIKRVVAVAGDRLQARWGNIRLNGTLLVEDYAVRDERMSIRPITIPQGFVFVMGDNRPRSEDSRDWGPIAVSALRGRAVLRYWPLARFGTVP